VVILFLFVLFHRFEFYHEFTIVFIITIAAIGRYVTIIVTINTLPNLTMHLSRPDAAPFVSFIEIDGPAVIKSNLSVSYFQNTAVDVQSVPTNNTGAVDARKRSLPSCCHRST
ncbi:hypothetical protein ACHAXS_010196, partial [Conticribra weissflogii]